MKQENLFSGKDGCTGRLEAPAMADNLYLFQWSEGNFISFIREKSGKFEK